MKCNNCGEEVLEGANFCPKCGTKIEIKEEIKEAEVVVEAETVEPETKVEEATVAVEVKPEPKKEEPEIVVKPAEVITPAPAAKPVPAPKPAQAARPAQASKASVEPTSGFAVASLVLGIVAAFLLFEHGFFNFVSAILAIIFGAIGRKKPGGKTMGTVGMILGIASLSILALIFAIVLFLGATFLTLGVIGAID